MTSTSQSLRVASAAFLIVLVAACGRAPAPQTDAQNNASAAQPASASTEFGERLLWVDPLKTCEAKQVTMVHWSKDAVAKGLASIEIGDVNPGVFARIGDEGQKETGTWAYPGAVLLIRGVGGEVRARQVMKGPPSCPAAVAVPAATAPGEAPAVAPATPATPAAGTEAPATTAP